MNYIDELTYINLNPNESMDTNRKVLDFRIKSGIAFHEDFIIDKYGNLDMATRDAYDKLLPIFNILTKHEQSAMVGFALDCAAKGSFTEITNIENELKTNK